METITNFEELRGVWMLAHVSYPGAYSESTACFAYPQYAFTPSGIKRIPQYILPDTGAIGVGVVGRRPGYAGSNDPDLVRAAFGDVVAMRINTREPLTNMVYGSGEGANRCKYFGSFNPSLPSGESPIEFQKVSSSLGTRGLYQVIELEGDIDLSVAPKGEVALGVGSEHAMTPRVVVEQVDGGSLQYYGPIEFRPTSEGRARLGACEHMARYVTCIDSSKAPEIITVHDVFGGGTTVAKFIDGTPFSTSRSKGTRKDWVSDEELIEKVAQGLKASKKLKNATAGEFKSVLGQCRLDGIYEQRRPRIEKLAETPEYWERLGDSLYSVMTRPEMAEHVVGLALTDRFMPLVKEKLVNTEAMRREAELAEAEVTRELNAKKAEREKAQLRVEEVQAQLAELEASYEETRARALASTKAELDKLEAQIAERGKELADIEADLESAQGRQAQVRSLMEDMLADRDALAAELMRDSVVRSAMDRASVRGVSADEFEGANISLKTHASEDELDDTQLAVAIQDVFSERAGRDLSLDETVNLLVCMVQSPITVLSGLPGTGKTSLVRALAGSLGLVGGASRRFVEVGVERGWTSHRDWIGYFNPISGSYEKSDPAVFDAVTALDRESASASKAPFLFLLDEMNLSPAEYYWAPFLRSCDTYNNEGCLVDLGGERKLLVPPQARFMATVNFDHTTEALSPRLLDRAWVLRLEPFEMDLDEAPMLAAPDYSGVPAYSWERLVKAFGPAGRKAVDSTVKDVFKGIVGAMSAIAPVSQRAQSMVRGYVAAASHYVDLDDPTARLGVLDRAVAQKVLPQLSLPASPSVDEMLAELQKECASLPMSHAIVNRMRKQGADNGFYTYFA